MPTENKNHRVKGHPKISHSLSPKYHIICCQFVTLHLIQRFYIIDLQWYGLHITSYRQTPNPEIEQPSPHAEAYISLTHLYRGGRIQAQRRRFWLPQNPSELKIGDFL